MREVLRPAAGRLCEPLALLSSVRDRIYDGINIVYYHWIGVPPPHYAAFASGCDMDRFRADLDCIQRYFSVSPLSSVVLGNSRSLSGKPALAITFDDGFDLIRSGVMRELDQRGLKATVLVITSCVGNRTLMWRGKLSAISHLAPAGTLLRGFNDLCRLHRLPTAKSIRDVWRLSYDWSPALAPGLAGELWDRSGLPHESKYLKEYRPYLDWEDLDRWMANGHEVGLHTLTHPRCDRLTPEGVTQEIELPATELRSRLRLQFLAFSYPFGPKLSASVAADLCQRKVVDCCLGIKGLSDKCAPLWDLDRACAEPGIHFPVFAKPVIGRFIAR